MAKRQKHGNPDSKSPKAPTDYDRLIGERIRLARAAQDITQVRLAKALDVSFQQVQKYENGSNRISAKRLYDIARLFHLEIGFFFEEIDDAVLRRRRRPVLLDRPAEEFTRLAAKITDPRVRARLLDLMQSLETVDE
jgi:transcriptional regulator with XRE-family HTH domain